MYSNYTRQEPVKCAANLMMLWLVQRSSRWIYCRTGCNGLNKINAIFAVSEKASRDNAVNAQGCERKKWKEMYHRLLHSNQISHPTESDQTSEVVSEVRHETKSPRLLVKKVGENDARNKKEPK